MPIYEYTCRDCSRLSSIFVRSVNTAHEPKCGHCGGANVQRAVSKVAYHRTEQQIMDDYGMPDPARGLDAYKDPRQIGRWVEQRFEQMGMDLPEEARTMIDAAREGEFPEPIKDL
ncbi:MAG: FmdB family zinc ribbon protein [Dehalococcoidia bacterium]